MLKLCNQTKKLFPLRQIFTTFLEEPVPKFKNEPSKVSQFLHDSFGRPHTYLRISLTERCNLRCQYCMPEEGVKLSPKPHLLTTDEILYLASLFAKLGVTKVRLTGGEPTINKDLLHIVKYLKKIPNIETVGMTTNGLSLKKILPELQKAGLNALNISLDTLDGKKFEKITRRKGFSRVIAAVDQAIELGFNPVKINCVVMRGTNENEITDFVEFTRNKSVDVRFIEYMPFGGNKWSTEKLVPYNEMMRIIKERYPSIGQLNIPDNFTSKPFKIAGFKGQIGFISSITEPFCGSCNRIRLLADGSLKVCLLGSAEISLREALRNNCSEDDILAMIAAALLRKKKQHAGLHWHKRQAEGVTSTFPDLRQLMYYSSYRRLLSANNNHMYERKFHYSTERDSGSVCDEQLTHLSGKGELKMVDVSGKSETSRSATAAARVLVSERIADLIARNLMKKGDVLAVARLAGISAAKRTSELIPLCHNIVLTYVDVKAALEVENSSIEITSEVRCIGKTGVEMEALTAASVAALTVYDMCKSVSHDIRITDVRLLRKTGGKTDFSGGE